ncbi:hypothetical protein [Microbacterium schleiferi]|uniref:Uncharacterized protein n=1 Tax=Microbacterium schleiferi TaxID=69362 RepID=A0ABU7V468_9MICO
MLSDDRSDEDAASDETGTGDVPDAAAPRPDEDLLSRLDIVESQPLSERAAAYEAIHEDLARRLEHNPEVPHQ